MKQNGPERTARGLVWPVPSGRRKGTRRARGGGAAFRVPFRLPGEYRLTNHWSGSRVSALIEPECGLSACPRWMRGMRNVAIALIIAVSGLITIGTRDAKAGLTTISGTNCQRWQEVPGIRLTYEPYGLSIKNNTGEISHFFSFCHFPTIETRTIRTLDMSAGVVEGSNLNLVSLCYSIGFPTDNLNFTCGPPSADAGPAYRVAPPSRPGNRTTAFMYIGALNIAPGKGAVVKNLTGEWPEVAVEKSTSATSSSTAVSSLQENEQPDSYVQGIYDEFSAEVRADDWAAAKEKSIRSSLQFWQNNYPFDISNIECRNKMCKVEIVSVNEKMTTGLSALLLGSVNCEAPLVQTEFGQGRMAQSGYFECRH